MTGSRVAVEVDTSGVFEDAVHLGEARSHKREVCAHCTLVAGHGVLEDKVVSFQAGVECFVGVAGVGESFYIGAGILCRGVPGPGVGERFGLREGVGEKCVVVSSAVEGRVGAYQVNAFVWHLAHDFKVVAKVEFVHWLLAVGCSVDSI